MNESRSWWLSPRLWMVGIVLFAAAVRLPNIVWDQNHLFHPDERAIANAALKLSLSDLNPDWFNYGSLPIYLTRGTCEVTARLTGGTCGYDGCIISGRQVSAIFGILTVFLTMVIGRRLYGDSSGLAAGILLAAAALHVQNSRFATVDVTLTFFVLMAAGQLALAAEDGKLWRFVVGGLFIGMAIGSKFSAMPLLLTLAVAGLASWRRVGFIAAAKGVVLATLAVVAAFFFSEPFAILNGGEPRTMANYFLNSKFIANVREQSNMVRNAGAMPYTTQYMNVPKYFYELKELVLWGMAPLFGVVAVWATATRPVTAWRTRRAADWVLLSWVIPFFLISGWFEVKFPRYLLPIYPMLALWAGDWLVTRYERRSIIGRLGLPLVIVGTVAATLAFTATYTRPHTVVTASEWFYSHVPPGSRVMTQDWDEGFPFALPGPNTNPSRYTIVAFPYYDIPDNPAKVQKLAKELASSDYIVFQTKRLYGAITRAPEADPKRPERRSYPYTSHYFYQLFAGDLGYTMIHETASRPTLFGIEVPDELADESLTVYDHPKVVFFQNTGKLDAATIADKILKRSIPSKPLTRDDILAMRPGGDNGASAPAQNEPIHSGVLSFVLLVGLLEILGLAMYPVLRRWLQGVGTYALSKTLGVLIFAYIAWLLASLGLASFTQSVLTVEVLIFAVVGFVLLRRGVAVPTPGREIVATEGLFWGVFLLFLFARMYNPEVYWGEKPMDFSFLNAISRTTTLPPPEPWFSGSELHYSYFGYFVAAALGKTLNLDTAVMFNLGIATFAAMTVAGAFAAGCALTRRWSTGILASLFVMILANLSGPREAVQRSWNLNFDYFWATSRVIHDTINEYPLWSFLFADLHAHLMVMPFSLTFIALTIYWVRDRIIAPREPQPLGSSLLSLLLLSLTLGTITVTNTWSTPTYVLLFLFLSLTIWITEGQEHGAVGFAWGFLRRVVVLAALVVGLSVVLYWPYWHSFVAPESNFGWERLTPDKLAQPRDFLQIWGVFLFILVPFVLTLWARALRRSDNTTTLTRRLTVVAIFGLIVAGFYASTRVGMTVLFLVGLQLLLSPRLERRWRLPIALATFGFAVTAGTDFVYVWDRMNTIFKFYLETWFLFSLAAAAAVQALWNGEVGGGVLRRLWQGVLVVLFAVAAFTSVTAVYGVIQTNRVQTPKPTLDGRAYLQQKSPDEYAAFKWLNQNIQGIPVILEAHGDSYQEFTRVSMNTGLPTVLGWGYHVYQRAHAWPDINRRKADIQTAYLSESKDEVGAILERYHVALVFVGGLERRTYAGGNLQRFQEWTDLLTPVYQNAGVTVFAVNGNFAGATPVSTIEDVPSEPEGKEPPRAADAPGVVSQPRGVAVNAEGQIIVADFGNHRIQLYGRDLSFVRNWGKQGELPGQFKEPCGVAASPSGEIFVADTWNQRVQVFGNDGKYLREFASGFYGPRGIAVDSKGAVFVADTGNNRIVRFSAAGQKEVEWGAKGSEPGKFFEPDGLAVAPDGTVFVADNGNGRMQVFSRDGQFQSEFPVKGLESKVFSEPQVAVDGRGNVWVTVSGDKEVRSYDRSGKLLVTIKDNSIPGVHFETPMGVAYSAAAKELVITDLENRIVRIPNVDR